MSFQPVRAYTGAILVAVLGLTGCRARADLGVTVREDGSGEVTFAVGLDEEARQFLIERGADPEAEVEKVLGDVDASAPAGTKEETWTEAGFRGRRFLTPLVDLADLAAFFNAPGRPPIVRADRDGSGLAIEVDLATLGGALGSGFVGAVPDDLSEHVDVRFTLRVPGRVVDHNADSVEGGSFVWRLVPTQTATARLRADLAPGAGSSLAQAVRPMVTGIGVLGLGWLGTRRFRARGQEPKARTPNLRGTGSSGP